MQIGEIRQTLRRLRKHRRFSLAVVFTLALGIGATVSVFSVIDAVLITPLPYPDSSRLFSIFQSKRANDLAEQENFSPGDFLDFRERNHSFTDLAAYCGFHYNLTGYGEPRHLAGIATSPGLFSILGVQPILGRTFLPEEDVYSSPHVTLLSHHLWSGEFHGDPQIVGKTISLNGDPYYVVGVLPRGFTGLDGDDTDVWIPLRQQIRPDRMLGRDQNYLTVVGRLRAGISLDQARIDVNRIASQLRAESPASNDLAGAVVMPLQQALVGETRTSLLLALAIVVLVLLIATSNVAILMLARVSGRTRELAVRMALGASASRIVRDVLAESVLLGLASGLLGIVFAVIGRRIILDLVPYNENIGLIQINGPVLAFAALVSILVGLGFGLLPALKVLKTDVQHVLRSAGNASTVDTGGRLLRHVLITGEISLSIILLIAAGLLLRSMVTLRRQPLGFRVDHVTASWIGLPRIRYQNNDDVANFFTRVDQNVRETPGIEAVGLGYPLPLQGNHFWTNFSISGKTTSPAEYEQASLRFIDSGFLAVMNIPILYGRNFTDADDGKVEPVALVGESFAHRYWPGEDAIGKYITIIRDTPVPRRIVGVVADVRATIEDTPPPTMYVFYKQMSFPSMQLVVLSQQSSPAVLQKVRRAVQSVDPDQPLEYATSMESIVREALDPWRFALSLLGALTGLATLLTAVGLMAVVSYLVSERTKELGLRMAIGASRMNVMTLVLRQSLKLALIGAVIGFAITLVVERLIDNMIYAIRPRDPSIFFAVACFIVMTSILAAYIPARRASRIEPLTALRED